MSAIEDGLDDLSSIASAVAKTQTLDLLADNVIGSAIFAVMQTALPSLWVAPAPPAAAAAATLIVSAASVTSQDSTNLVFKGAFPLPLAAPGSPAAVPTTVIGWLFDHGFDRHLALLFGAPPDLPLTAFLGGYSRSPGAAAAFLTGGGAAPLMKSAAFDGPNLLFSSFDFRAPADAAPAWPGVFAASVKAGDVGPGLNFAAKFALADAFADVFAALALPGSFSVAAVIEAGPAGPLLTLAPDFPQASVALSSLKLDLLGVRLSLALAGLGGALPDVELTGVMHLGGTAISVQADFDLGAQRLRSTMLSPTALPSIADLSQALGLGDVGALLPSNAGGYGAFTLESFFISIDFGPIYFNELALSLSTERPVTLLPGVMALTPLLSLRVIAPFDSAARAQSVTLGGVWLLGATAFSTLASLSEQTFSADMAPGQSLDVSAALDAVLPGVRLPPGAIRLLDLELSADWGNKTFEADIDFATDWTFSLAGTPFTVSGLGMQMAYAEGAVTQCEISGFFTIAGLELSALAAYEGGGWTLRASTPPGVAISLRGIIQGVTRDIAGLGANLDLLPLDYLASAAGDIAVKDLFLEHATAGTGHTTFYASLDHSLVFASGFSLDTLFVSMTVSAGELVVQGQAMLTLAGAAIVLSAQKQAGGLQFKGGTAPGAALPIGDLIAEVATKFGAPAAIPDVLHALALSNLAIVLDTATKSFSVGGSLAAASGAAPSLGSLLGAAPAPELGAAATDFSLRYDDAAALVSVAVGVSGTLSLGPVKLENLHVLFQRQKAAAPAAAAASASVTGEATLGGVVFDVSALYSGGGWTLEASAQAEPGALSLGALLADLNLPTPDILKEASLRSVSLSYASAPQAATRLAVAGGLALGDGLTLEIDLDKTAAATAVGGRLSIGTLALDLAEAGGAVTAQWRAGQGEGLGVTDLAAAFGLDLPHAGAGIGGFKLTEIDVAYRPAA